MYVRTLNLLSGSIKKRLWWSMKGYFKVSKGNANSISPSWEFKKRLGRSRLSVVLSRRMGERIHNLPSDVLINDLGEVEEVMYQDV
jgi:hypothetical protein